MRLSLLLASLLFVTVSGFAQGILPERWSLADPAIFSPGVRTPTLSADWDGDGAKDILLVTPGVTTFGTPLPETMTLLSGADGSTLTSFTNNFLLPPGSQAGYSVIRGGLIDDVTGDGHADILLMRQELSGLSLSLELRSGADMSLVFDRAWLGSSASLVQPRLIVPGDMNGDGLSEIAVSVPSLVVSGQGTGAVEVIDPVTGTTVATLTGSPTSLANGEALVAVGDVDADGLADLVVGGPDTLVAGHLECIRGGSFSPIWYRVTAIDEGGPTNGYTGPSYRGAFPRSDVNGDGVRDALVLKATGAALISGITGQTLIDVNSLGGTIRSIGDANGDGQLDYASVPAFFGQSTTVYDGKTDLPMGTLVGERLSIALGDMNGDGFDEFLVQQSGSLIWRVRSFAGFDRYGAASTPLDLTFRSRSLAPRIELTGAASLATLLVVVGVAPTTSSFSGIPLFVDPQGMSFGFVGADAAGTWRYWTSLDVPVLSGQSIFLQVFETGSNLHSNGLELLFQP